MFSCNLFKYVEGGLASSVCVCVVGGGLPRCVLQRSHRSLPLELSGRGRLSISRDGHVDMVAGWVLYINS